MVFSDSTSINNIPGLQTRGRMESIMIFFYLRKSVKDSLPCSHDEKKEMERNPGIFFFTALVRFHQAGVSVGNEYVKISISNEKWHL